MFLVWKQVELISIIYLPDWSEAKRVSRRFITAKVHLGTEMSPAVMLIKHWAFYSLSHHIGDEYNLVTLHVQKITDPV